jgi:predicted metal-binding membrane protein
MAILLALGAMNVLWMGVVTALVLVQKLLPPRSRNATEGARR